MQQYLNSLNQILNEGILVPNRTGVSSYTYPHMMIRHDMQQGFPLITTKKMAWKSIKVELEFFIKGLTDKKWLQERGCTIWNEWCNPAKIPSGLNDAERKAFQLQENDLGVLYGAQWRNFNSQGVDQLKTVVNGLKNDPTSRRWVVSAWNPCQLNEMALPPCVYTWHVFAAGNKLNLCYMQRSVDFFLGESWNLASFGLLLHLLCMETGYTPGVLTAFLSNCHIYENHLEAVKVQLQRKPYPLPTVKTDKFTNIFDWTFEDTTLENYNSHPSIKAEIAV